MHLHWLWWLGCKLYALWRFTVHTACIPAPHNHSHHYQCRTPYAAVHTLVLLMMVIMMPETCWDKSLLTNIRLVASCWFLSLHPTPVYIIRLPHLLQNTYAIKNKNVPLMLITYFFLVCSTSSLLTRKKKVLYNILPLKLYWAIQSSSYSHNAISLQSI